VNNRLIPYYYNSFNWSSQISASGLLVLAELFLNIKLLVDRCIYQIQVESILKMVVVYNPIRKATVLWSVNFMTSITFEFTIESFNILIDLI